MDGVENAVIAKTSLGVEDHGLFTALVTFDGGSWGQAMDPHALDDWDEEKRRRVGTAFGLEYIKRLISTVGVPDWEHLRGSHVRIRREGGVIVAVGHFMKDSWFEPSILAREYFP